MPIATTVAVSPDCCVSRNRKGERERRERELELHRRLESGRSWLLALKSPKIEEVLLRRSPEGNLSSPSCCVSRNEDREGDTAVRWCAVGVRSTQVAGNGRG
ncbi:hypothetical protein JCGZ_13486 [Jatropha curcas]|uniref:Uncharacterized protein n=1 Tax=Jatropha curcas TaxID=180498 RepID=A0A067LMJ9_JATCU|nr:hypothetical protein JCGZ_13486 [Jatropha curcas]